MKICPVEQARNAEKTPSQVNINTHCARFAHNAYVNITLLSRHARLRDPKRKQNSAPV